jgi:hypothetical protein
MFSHETNNFIPIKNPVLKSWFRPVLHILLPTNILKSQSCNFQEADADFCYITLTAYLDERQNFDVHFRIYWVILLLEWFFETPTLSIRTCN